MPELVQGLCPICNGRLARKTVEIERVVVPDNASEAPYHGLGEVLRRGRMYPATISGRREIVQDLKVWLGEFDSPWAPFCTVTCAARFAVDAWASGYTGGTLAALPAPPATEGGMIAAGLQRLVTRMSQPQLPPPTYEPPAPVAVASHTPKPGDDDWHPPGKPPPVPGVFKYGKGGNRVRLDPEAMASRQARLEKTRVGRMAGLAKAHKTREAAKAAKIEAAVTHLPELTPEIREALEAPLDDGGKLTPARALRMRQLWPDLRFPVSVVVQEINKLPGEPYAGVGSMTAVAIQLGLPSRRLEAYRDMPIRGVKRHDQHAGR